jgi:hypothetical protein
MCPSEITPGCRRRRTATRVQETIKQAHFYSSRCCGRSRRVPTERPGRRVCGSRARSGPSTVTSTVARRHCGASNKAQPVIPVRVLHPAAAEGGFLQSLVTGIIHRPLTASHKRDRRRLRGSTAVHHVENCNTFTIGQQLGRGASRRILRCTLYDIP